MMLIEEAVWCWREKSGRKPVAEIAESKSEVRSTKQWCAKRENECIELKGKISLKSYGITRIEEGARAVVLRCGCCWKKEEEDGGAGRRICSLRSVGELAGWPPDGGASEGEGTDVGASGKLGIVPRGLLCWYISNDGKVLMCYS